MSTVGASIGRGTDDAGMSGTATGGSHSVRDNNCRGRTDVEQAAPWESKTSEPRKVRIYAEANRADRKRCWDGWRVTSVGTRSQPDTRTCGMIVSLLGATPIAAVPSNAANRTTGRLWCTVGYLHGAAHGNGTVSQIPIFGDNQRAFDSEMEFASIAAL